MAQLQRTVDGKGRAHRWLAAGLLLLAIGIVWAMVEARVAFASPTGVARYVSGPPAADSGNCISTSCRTIGYALSQAASSGDTIVVSSGTYTENLNISKNVTINGQSSGGHGVTVRGDGASSQRVITVTVGMSVTLSNLTITKGTDNGFGGGGIQNKGTLLMSGVVITGNYSSATGGGIYNSDTGIMTLTNGLITNNTAGTGGGLKNAGTAAISGSVISSNTTTGVGGGISNSGVLVLSNGVVINRNNAVINIAFPYDGGGAISNNGTLTVTNAALYNNQTSGSGGGINNTGTAWLSRLELNGNSAPTYGGGLYNVGTATLVNTTFYSNTTGSAGGAILSDFATTKIAFATISHNTAPGSNGGGLYAYGGGLIIKNSILSANSGGNCSGYMPSGGYNVEDANTCSFAQTGDIANTNPLLGPIRMNPPGRNQTMALLPGSPAINRVPIGACTDFNSVAVATDQRGVPRPSGSACDSGAYELLYSVNLPLIVK